jgi:hypothetical protein
MVHSRRYRCGYKCKLPTGIDIHFKFPLLKKYELTALNKEETHQLWKSDKHENK